jgi:hypothetical protein
LKGSTRITGKDAPDLHEKELAIPVTVHHPFDDLYSIFYLFQLTGVHRSVNAAQDGKAGSAKDLLLAIQRQVVNEFRHHYVSQQPCGRYAFVDHLRRYRCLTHRAKLSELSGRLRPRLCSIDTVDLQVFAVA